VTEDAPQAIGPYSQAVVVDGMVYTAGQIALDPKTGASWARPRRSRPSRCSETSGDPQGRGLRIDRVVKTTVYLADMADFSAYERGVREVLPTHKPARSTIQAAALPKAAAGGDGRHREVG